MTARLVGLVVACAAAVACGRAEVGSAIVERQSVSLNLLMDGSVEVRESLRVRFLAEPVSSFRRHLDGEWTDGYIDVRASFDGQPVDTGTSPARVEIDREGSLDVRWTFPATSDATREFVVEYRVAGAMAVYGANGVLHWQALPLTPAYPVVESEISLSVPPGAVHMTPPELEAATPWEVTRDGTRLIATRSGLAPGESAAVSARLASDTLALARPAWQFSAERAAELMPAFASGGIFMVVVGVGVLWMVAVMLPRPKPADGPPAAVPGGFVPTLRSRRGIPVMASMAATLEVLAARGALDGPDSAGAAGLEHERILVDELWLRQGDQGQPMPTRAAGLVGVRRPFRAALSRELIENGLVDPDRLSAAAGLKLSGLVVIGLGVACAAVVPWLLPRFGWWPEAVPAGMVVLGVMLGLAGARFTILSAAGERAAAQYTSRL